jgi:hypothetical protein
MRSIEQIANDYVRQDNMMTAMPFGFVLQEIDERVSADGNDFDYYSVGIQGDYTDLENKEQVWELFCEWEGLTMKEAKEKYKEESWFDLKDLIEHLFENARIIPVKKEYKNSYNMFFTKSGYEEHLMENRHNLRSPRPYGIHLYRNPEMKVILFSVMQHATIPIEEWNHEARRFYLEMKELMKNE